MACALGVLQACSGTGAVAPTAPQQTPMPAPAGSTPVASPAATVGQITPDTLLVGTVVTITGTNLPTTPSAIRLSIAGVALDVRAASATRIEALVPATGFACAAPAAQTLRLELGATTLQQTVVLRTATPLALTAGDAAVTLNAEQAACVELAGAATGAAKYVVAVVNTATQSTATARFDLRGLGTGALANVASVVQSDANVMGLRAASAFSAPSALSASEAVPADDARHAAHLAADRAVFAQAGIPARTRLSAVRAPAALGDTLQINALLNSCTTGRAVRARVVYAGAKAVVLEDIASPRAGRMDDALRAIGSEFDATVYPLLTKNLGDPLALNGQLNGDGRITMLFTRFVNDSSPGTSGYVSACNFYPKTKFAASNEDEVFYARVPSTNETADDWRRALRSTVVHESKHLASYAERLSRGANSEESWLEEATARVAEELYARTFPGGGTWKGNTGFAASVGCELTQCDDRPLVMWKHFSQLHAYLRGADSLTPFGPAKSGDVTYYASGWSLVRWAVDQYAANESGMLKALVAGTAPAGVAGLAQIAGVPADQLLAGWAMSNAVGPASATWNAADMWSGLAGTFPGIFQSAPLRGRAVSAGSFVFSGLQLPGAGATYLTLNGVQGGGQVVQLAGVNGGALRVSVQRVQ
ncbi:MAG: IPT/TIG domain-containing protein [Gemmatimonadaceae bacterium]|nr:IPT/TIG domain-containing protein [Gemmatimonadaceae bacterium]